VAVVAEGPDGGAERGEEQEARKRQAHWPVVCPPVSAEQVRIREVGPRDGFQNEPEVIPTQVKVELIDGLARTGVQRLEITSFVRADVIPQAVQRHLGRPLGSHSLVAGPVEWNEPQA
jgi:hypothetical protein